ncbi:phage repressor protein C with HTH and peptisase S24 domain [Paracidovorax citrulli]|nr:phage repressor protein C with HTH and peptisase S24 domain [Paracidovorax citrulli]
MKITYFRYFTNGFLLSELRRVRAMATEYGSRLRAARNHAGLSQVELSKITGIAQSTISTAERTGNGSADTPVYARACGVDAHWLATGEGQMLSQPATPTNATPYETTKVRPVYVVGRGNGGAMPERLWTDGDFPVGGTDECADVATNDPRAFLIRVEGPSMVPRYNPGEYALVEPDTEPEIEDDVLVRLVDGQTILKRLLSRRGGWRLGSYNSMDVLFYSFEEVTWVYYVAHPVPRRKIKARC